MACGAFVYSTAMRIAVGAMWQGMDMQEVERDNGLLRLVRIPEGIVWVPSRAITLTVPWAWTMLSVNGGDQKDFENRTRGFSYINFRGPVWVHNACKVTTADAAEALALCGARGLNIPSWDDIWYQRLPTLQRRAIVGLLWLDERLAPTPRPVHKWHFPGHHGFHVGRTATVKPVQCNGQQGFWRVPPGELAQLARQVLARPELAEAIRGPGMPEPLDIK